MMPLAQQLHMQLVVAAAGANRCDRRRLLSATRAQFPGVEFGLVATDDDEWWEREHAVPQAGAQASWRHPIKSDPSVLQRCCKVWLSSAPHVALVLLVSFASRRDTHQRSRHVKLHIAVVSSCTQPG